MERYADNMILLKIYDFPETDIGLQLGNSEMGDNIYITCADIDDRKNGILYQNSISYDEENEIPLVQFFGEAEELITDEDGFVIGYHQKHRNCIFK